MQAGAEAAKLMKELDSDGDGSVGFAEFSAGMAADSIDVEATFKQFDKDNDGLLSAEEVEFC